MSRVPILFLFLVLLAVPTLAAPPLTSVLAVDRVGESGIAPAADLLSVILLDAETAPTLRVSMLSLATDLAPIVPNGATRDDLLRPVTLTVHVNDQLLLRSELAPDGAGFEPASRDMRRDGDALLIPVAPAFLASGRATFTITTSDGDQVTAAWPAGRDYLANCAFALHGNQGLGYTDVFHGRADDLEGSGFDEALQIHESLAVPVNLHLSGTLMTVADWAHQEGDPQDFNSWLADGVTGGWVGMLTSAYAQHIMPFVNQEMNNWAVHIETQMVSDRYGYTPTVAEMADIAPEGIDWLCVSPKGRAPVLQTSGNELKLVYPQAEPEAQPDSFAHLGFRHFFLQPLDSPERDENTRSVIDYCLRHPQWKLSLQTHKIIGID